MRILVAAVTAVVLLSAAGASAQSLEKTYADLCSDPAKAQSESCVALWEALVAKRQGHGAVPAGATPAVSSASPEPAGDNAAVTRAVPANVDMGAIWGVYAKLIGSSLETGKNGPPSTWRWGQGEEIIEEVQGLGFRKIARGAAIGELVMREGRHLENLDEEWHGTVAADGAVVFVPAPTKGLMKDAPRRISLADGVVVVENLKIKDGHVVEAWESFRYFGKIGAGHAPDVLVAPSTARGTKEDPVPLVAGQKVRGRLDGNSPRSWGNRVTYYRLRGNEGQSVVIGMDCDVEAYYSCIYTGVDPEKSKPYQVQDVQTPTAKAFRFTLGKDDPLLQVWSAGNINFAVVALDGVAGEALWAETKAARARYDAALAQAKRERSAERGALFGAVMQGLAQGAAEASYEQQQAQATQDAMLAQVQQQTMQIQQAHAQAAAQQRAAELQVSADSQRLALEEVEAQRLAAEQQRLAQIEASSQSAVPSNSTPSAAIDLSRRDPALADCPYVPRVVNGISGIHESKGDAEAKARSGVRCGYGGVESMGVVSCTSHMKVDVTMSNGKTSKTESPRWVCNVDATCVVGTPICTDRPKGSSEQ